MPRYFKQSLITGLSQDAIDAYIVSTPITRFDCYSRLRPRLTDNEIKATQRGILMLTKYLLEKNKFVFPSQANKGKIYRAGKLNSGDARNGYFPISKSAASNCPTPGEPLEPIWFGLEPLYVYLRLSQIEPNGLVTCRTIKDYGNFAHPSQPIEIRCNMVVNLSTNNRVPFSNGPGEGYLLSLSLQEAINRAILIPIVRGFSDGYSLVNYPHDLTYDYIIANAENIPFTGTVQGYDCDAGRYQGDTIATLLQAWSMADGTRFSRFNHDRIQIQVLFEVFEWVEAIINNFFPEIFEKSFINNFKTVESAATYNMKFNLIGWFCEDVPRGRDRSKFPGEYALSIKYFAKPIRYEIFDKQRDDCKPKFFVFAPNSPSGYLEVTGPPVANPFAQQPPMPSPNPGAPNPFAQRPPFKPWWRGGSVPLAELNDDSLSIPSMQFSQTQGVNNLVNKLDSRIVVADKNGQLRPSEEVLIRPVLEDDKEEYYYSKEPESPDSDLFQVFFANNPEEEEKYTDEPKEMIEIIKKYGEEQEKQERKKTNEFNPKLMVTVKKTPFNPRPQFSRTQGGKLSKKHKQKSSKKKVSKTYSKKLKVSKKYSRKLKRHRKFH